MIVIKTFIMSEYDFDDNSREFDADRDSDEDTEDASETDMAKQEQEYTEIKEQMYQDKLANLKKQLQQLQDETHPEYLRRLKKLEQAYQERLFLNEAFQCYEIERVEAEYISEKKAAVWEFEDKKVELRENLIAELEEKKRIIENERSNIELTGDSIEVKPVTTRKLRRRPNEPLPVPEKRRVNFPLLDQNKKVMKLCHIVITQDQQLKQKLKTGNYIMKKNGIFEVNQFLLKTKMLASLMLLFPL
ncbi:sin3 histone deacetylase corepressor complex component SDS3 isoform X8 [Tachypleus tridentatus]|uniref:sin3 histone deacetylase corepressor complex component SDS3 isoform X8 n=1 Tax=Tachypleus tridentatus TaxID=6853 RepID=UPI003FD64083